MTDPIFDLDWPTAKQAARLAEKLSTSTTVLKAYMLDDAVQIARRYAELVGTTIRKREAIVAAIKRKGQSNA